MGKWRRARGFTLIEMLITVVVISVLAVLAVVGYGRYIRASHVEEGQDMVIRIRSAEEAFLAENGVYLDVSGCLGAGCSYPAQHPGAFNTAWGGPCGWCKNPTSGWTGLAVWTDAPVYFGYSVIADQTLTPAGRGVGAAQPYRGQTLNVGALGANGAPWYFVQADANLSGDGVHFTHVYGMTGMSQLFVDGAGN